MSASDTLIVGKIGAPHGVKGWVKINSFTQEKQNIFDYSPWLLNIGAGEEQSIEVDQWKVHSSSLVAKLKGIDDRNNADLIKNATISILTSQLPELEDGYYWKDLLGMQVKTSAGYDMGLVKDMFETGANDVMLVKANVNDAYGQKERLIPFLFDDVVLEVDKQGNTILVDWDPAF